MARVAFEIVNHQVEKMYQVHFEDSDVDGINKHCEAIAEFIMACGWDTEEFTAKNMGWKESN